LIHLCNAQNSEFEFRFTITISESLLNTWPNPECEFHENLNITSIDLNNSVRFQKKANVTYKILCVLCQHSQYDLIYLFSSPQFEEARLCTMTGMYCTVLHCTYVCMYVCMYICMYTVCMGCIHACMCVCTCIHM